MKKLIELSPRVLKVIEEEAKSMKRSVKAQIEWIITEGARQLENDKYIGGNQKFN